MAINISDASQLAEGWRKLAFQIQPSSGAFSGGFTSQDVKNFLGTMQTPYSGPSHNAQWLRKISLIVYGGTENVGSDYSGGGDKPPPPAPKMFSTTNEELRRKMLGRQLRVITRDDPPPSTTLDDVQVTASPPTETSTPSGGQGLELGALRITFNVHKKTLQTPDLFDCRIYNLSPETRQKIMQFGRVQLSAGYQFANYGMIFDGTVVQYRHGKENPTDTYLEIIAGDGDKLNGATSFRRFDAGTKESEAISTLVKDTGFPLGYISQSIGNQQLVRPWVIAGTTQQYLREMAQKYGSTFWVDQGKLYMVTHDEYLNNEAVVLAPTTGLVDIPEDTPNGIQCRCLINPKIKLGGRVKLDKTLISGVAYQPGGTEMTGASFEGFKSAARLNADVEIPQPTSPTGDYKIIMMEISGDTRGKPWYMDLVCIATDANGKINPNVTKQSAFFRANAEALGG